MDWSAALRNALPPPAHRAAAPSAADWAAAEAALGVTLPADYKQFLSEWGPAQVGAFFYTLSPGHPNRVVELVEKARYVTHALGTLKAHPPRTYTAPVFPDEGSFLAWGLTDNGDFLGWMVTGRDPEAWPAAVWGEEDGTPEVFEGAGFGGLMAGIVTGTIRPAAFPADVWDEVALAMEPLGSE